MHMGGFFHVVYKLASFDTTIKFVNPLVGTRVQLFPN